MKNINKPKNINYQFEKEYKQPIIDPQNEKQGTIKDLCSQPILRQNLSIQTVLWSFSSFSYFLIPFYIADAQKDSNHSNVYEKMLSAFLAEILANVLCLFVTKLLSLKTGIIGFCCMIFVSTAILLALKFNDGSSSIELILLFTTNFGVNCVFSMCYLINPELFPTLFLSTAYGICNISCRFITIFSPIVSKW